MGRDAEGTLMELQVPHRSLMTGEITLHPKTCYYPTRGLAVQREGSVYPEASELLDGRPRWGIVHLPSGQLVVPCVLASRAEARRCQQALLALDIEWTQDVSAAWLVAITPLVVPVRDAWVPKEEEETS